MEIKTSTKSRQLGDGLVWKIERRERDTVPSSWYTDRPQFLSARQFAQVREPYETLADLLANGRKNILVVVAHQDDEVISMGGAIKGLANGVLFRPDEIGEQDWHQMGHNRQGFQWAYTRSEFAAIQSNLARGNLLLNPLYEEPSNVIVVYVTNGAKEPETVLRDLSAAHPTWSHEKILEYYSDLWDRALSLEELTTALNTRRYREAITSLDYVDGSAAVFLENNETTDIMPGEAAVYNIAEIIGMLQPAAVYTHSPFEIKHNTHIHVSEMTVAALRGALSHLKDMPLFRSFAIWNPFEVSEPIAQLEVVDITQVFDMKTDAIHVHSTLGSQGTLGYKRFYEAVRYVNQMDGHRITNTLEAMLDDWQASFRRPRLPWGIFQAEVFMPMDVLLEDHSMALSAFASHYFEKFMARYPLNQARHAPVLPP